MVKSINAASMLVLILLFLSPVNIDVCSAQNENRLLIAARQFENSDRYDEALAIYQKLWEGNPNNITYYNGLKNNSLRSGRFDIGIDAVKRMMNISKSHSYQADLGEIIYKSGDKDKALSIWNQMIEAHVKERDVYSVVANSMITNNLIQEAIDVYESGREQFKEESYFIIELANLYSMGFQYRKATLAYLELLSKDSDKYSFVESQLLRLGQHIEEYEPIIDILKKESSKNKDTIYQYKLLASLYIRSSNYQKAFETFSYIDELSSKHQTDDGSGDSLLDFAKLALRDKEYDFAIKAYTAYLSKHPQQDAQLEAYMGLAESYHVQGNFIKSIDYYSQIIREFGNHSLAQTASLHIGTIYLSDLFDYEKAKASFDQIINKVPRSPLYHLASFHRGECDIKEGNLASGTRWLETILNASGASDESKEKALFYLAKISFWKGDFPDAIKKLNTISDTQISMRIGDRRGLWVNDALELLFLLEESHQDPEVLRTLAESDLLHYQNKMEQAHDRLYESAQNYRSSDSYDDIVFRMGELNFLMKRYEQALKNFSALIVEKPQSRYCDEARNYMAQIYFPYLNDKERALKEYEKLLLDYPQSLLVEEVRQTIRELEDSLKGNK